MLPNAERPRAKLPVPVQAPCRPTAAGLAQFLRIRLHVSTPGSFVIAATSLPPPTNTEPCSLAGAPGPVGLWVCEDRGPASYSWGPSGPAGGRREMQSPRGADVGGGPGEVLADLSPGTRCRTERGQPAGMVDRCRGADGERQAGGKAAGHVVESGFHPEGDGRGGGRLSWELAGTGLDGWRGCCEGRLGRSRAGWPGGGGLVVRKRCPGGGVAWGPNMGWTVVSTIGRQNPAEGGRFERGQGYRWKPACMQH